MLSYLHWQFLAAPAWLVALSVNLQRALLQYFSIPFMLRTLVSHWHKDVVAYRGSITSHFTALAWNLISRGIGFLIRISILVIYLAGATTLLAASLALIAVLFIWPFAVLLGLIWSLTNLRL